MANLFTVSPFSMLRRIMFYFFGKHFSMSSKYSIFVDEPMIRIIYVVDILRENAHSKTVQFGSLDYILLTS